MGVVKVRPGLGAGFYYALAGVALMLAGVVAPDVFHLTPRMKELVFFGCMAAAFLCVIAGAAKEARSESASPTKRGHKRRMIAIYGMLISGLTFIAFATAYFWPTEDATTEATKPPDAENRPSVAPISTAYFDCGLGWWPEAESAPKNSFMIEVMQFGDSNPTIGIGSGPPVKEHHNKEHSSSAPIKCEITFHGKSPIFNITTKISIDLYEVITGSNNNSNGKLIKTLETDLSFKQVIIPGQNVFTFYVFSFDVNAYIGVRLPDKFSFIGADADTRHEGKFITSSPSPMLTGPPPSVPPVPTPTK